MSSAYQSVFRSNLFSGRTMVVTGGGTGIGRCVALELASLGAQVALLGRRVDKLEAVAKEITQAGGKASTHSCDIRDEAQVRDTVAAVVAAHSRIHGLVNNAGAQFPAPLASITQEGFETVLRTNLVGGFLVAREVFTQAMRDHGGAIVNVVADFWRGMPGMGHSGAARAGMANLTQTAAIEWAASGVRVNAVAPGLVASPGLENQQGPIQNMLRKLQEAVPLKRLASESEVSAAICFLLSDAAAFVTGETLRVDGGSPLAGALWPVPSHDRSKPFLGLLESGSDPATSD